MKRLIGIITVALLATSAMSTSASADDQVYLRNYDFEVESAVNTVEPETAVPSRQELVLAPLK